MPSGSRAAGIDVELRRGPRARSRSSTRAGCSASRTGVPLVTVEGRAVARRARSPSRRASAPPSPAPSGAEVTRRLRAAADAVLVSAATVIADDPALTVRDADGALAERQPLRVVLVREPLPRSRCARVFTDGAAPTLVLASRRADAGVVRRHSGRDRRRTDARATARSRTRCWRLGERGVGELLVEPGPRLFSALWDERSDRSSCVTVTAGGMAGADAPALYLGEPDRAGRRAASRA